jgi:hypothetical protein
VDSEITRFQNAIKTLRILGQILKNFPGTLEGASKTEITRECYHLGLRAVTEVLELVKALQIASVESIADSFPRNATGERLDRAMEDPRDKAFGLARAIAFSMIRIISASVGAPELMATYARVQELSEAPAISLITASLQLDHERPFPSKDIVSLNKELDGRLFSQSLLRLLVVRHFDLFPVKFGEKQRICEKLGIKYYRLVQLTDPAKRLVKAK